MFPIDLVEPVIRCALLSEAPVEAIEPATEVVSVDGLLTHLAPTALERGVGGELVVTQVLVPVVVRIGAGAVVATGDCNVVFKNKSKVGQFGIHCIGVASPGKLWRDKCVNEASEEVDIGVTLPSVNGVPVHVLLTRP